MTFRDGPVFARPPLHRIRYALLLDASERRIGLVWQSGAAAGMVPLVATPPAVVAAATDRALALCRAGRALTALNRDAYRAVHPDAARSTAPRQTADTLDALLATYRPVVAP